MRVPRTSPCLRLARLAVAALLVLPAALSADGPLTNGQNHTDTISVPGEIDTWTFTATAGDAIILAIGEVGPDTAFVPWIRLIRPDAVVIGNTSGALAAQIEVAATQTGTYTVLVGSFDSGQNDTGSYQLTLAKTPGAFSISGGDEGGPLTNGSNHTGLIHVGDLDMWSFDATAGDDIIVAIGEVGDTALQPWIRLKSPTGQDLGSTSGALAAQIDSVATVTGTYTVIVSTFDSGLDATGSYTLTIAKSPGAFTISPGDHGGALTNGSNHTGSIHVGDLDMWSFNATAGDDIAVAIGEVGTTGLFQPWIRLRSPTGQDLGSLSGAAAQQIDSVATVTGTYTVVVSTFDSGLDATGDYTLTLAKSPGAFTISPGDDGGALTNGSNHTGSIHVGDLDMWSFDAIAGDDLIVAIGEVGPDSAFQPWIRLRSPTGQDLGSLSGVLAQQIDSVATVTGTYTVIVSTFDSGLDATGNYTLTLAKTGSAFTIAAGDHGGAMTNGGNFTGDIHVGDLDMWSFTATAGEALTVAIGEVGPNSAFQPWIRLRSPTGQDLGSLSGALAQQINATATVTGMYIVVVSTFDSGLDATGSYTLTIANTPRAFVVPVGDHGGPLADGSGHPGSIFIGDLDMWTFSAYANDPLTISIVEVGTPADFNPWIRLRTPSGAQIGSAAGATGAQIVVTASETGLYTIVVGTADSGLDGAGDYLVSATGNSTDMIKNGDFSLGEQFWSFFATPTMGHIIHNVTNGILHEARVPPPPGPNNQAVAFQSTGVSLPVGAPLLATFQLGNTSSARKYTKVLLVGDLNFNDLFACTFWLEPNAPLRTYAMRAYTTLAWTNTAIYFYASSPQTDGGFYQVDNVSLKYVPEQETERVDCVDPLAPTPQGGVAGPNLVVNGDFGTGAMAPWTTFGTVTVRNPLVGGVLEFHRPANTHPAGVVLQSTGQALPQNEILTATFQLGNSSLLRQRALVLVNDGDFTDLVACTFWMEPGQALWNYEMKLYTSKPWTNAMVSVYPSTITLQQWVRLDNVTLRRTPAASTVGTECLELGPGPVPPEASSPEATVAPATAAGAAGATGRGEPSGSFEAVASTAGAQVLSLAAIDLRNVTGARLMFDSQLRAAASRAVVQVSLDGETWTDLHEVPASDDWTAMDIDLTAFAGELVYVRFVLDATTTANPAAPDVWRIDNVRVDTRLTTKDTKHTK